MPWWLILARATMLTLFLWSTTSDLSNLWMAEPSLMLISSWDADTGTGLKAGSLNVTFTTSKLWRSETCIEISIYAFDYRETDEELGFMEAVHTCIGYHYSKTPFQGLIPVGRLRCIRNRFKSTSGDDVCGRFFRVNAIKDNRGVWREHPSGQRVEFHHYPEFDPLHGSAGDTLIWDAFLNRLYIDDQHDHYNAMCYRDYENGMLLSP